MDSSWTEGAANTDFYPSPSIIKFLIVAQLAGPRGLQDSLAKWLGFTRALVVGLTSLL